MLAILHARRTTQRDHAASPQRRRYEEELIPWRVAFDKTEDLFADTPGRVGALRRSQIVRVLHPSGAFPALVAKRLFGTPFVVHLGYDPARLCRIRGATVKARVWDVWLRLLAHEAAGFLVSANPQRWRKARAVVFYAPNGADPSLFNPGLSADDSYIRVMAPQLLYAGRDSWEKNLAMLRAVFGRGGSSLGSLRLATDRPWREMPDVYRSSTAFALPSLYEGSPKALWEAMACGVPALVTAAIEDRPPADTCVILDPHDVGGWARAIRTVLSGSPEAEARAARALAWVRRKRDARVLIRREVAFAVAVAQGVDDPVRWVETETERR